MRPGPGINLSSNLSSTSRLEMPTQCPILSLQPTRIPLGIRSSKPFQPNRGFLLYLYSPRRRFSDYLPFLPAEFFRGHLSEEIEGKVFPGSKLERTFFWGRNFASNRFDSNDFLLVEDWKEEDWEIYLSKLFNRSIFIPVIISLYIHPVESFLKSLTLLRTFESRFLIFTSRKLNVFLSPSPPFGVTLCIYRG